MLNYELLCLTCCCNCICTETLCLSCLHQGPADHAEAGCHGDHTNRHPEDTEEERSDNGRELRPHKTDGGGNSNGILCYCWRCELTG